MSALTSRGAAFARGFATVTVHSAMGSTSVAMPLTALSAVSIPGAEQLLTNRTLPSVPLQTSAIYEKQQQGSGCEPNLESKLERARQCNEGASGMRFAARCQVTSWRRSQACIPRVATTRAGR